MHHFSRTLCCRALAALITFLLLHPVTGFSQAPPITFTQFVGETAVRYLADGEKLQTGFPVDLTIQGAGREGSTYYYLNGGQFRAYTGRLHLTNSVILSASAVTPPSIYTSTGHIVIEINPELYPELRLIDLFGQYNKEELLPESTDVYASALVRVDSTFENGHTFYTLDRSTPTRDSTPYTGPILLTNSALVRVAAFNQDFTRSLTGQSEITVYPPFFLWLQDVPPAKSPLVTISATGPYHTNDLVTLTAQDGEGWTFKRWTGDVESTNRTVQLLMDAHKIVVPKYETVVLTSVATNQGRIAIEPENPEYGQTVSLTATPAAGFYFNAWGGALTGRTNPAFLRVTNGMPTVSAEFLPLAQGQFSLTVRDPLDFPIVAVTPVKDLYSAGEIVQAKVDLAFSHEQAIGPHDYSLGKRFVGWTNDASGTDNPLSVLMDRSKVIEPRIEPAYPMQQISKVAGWNGFYSVVAEDGTVYIAAQDAFSGINTLSSLTPDLKTNWVLKSPYGGLPVIGELAIGDSGNVYCMDRYGDAVCVSPTGEILWKFVSGGPPRDFLRPFAVAVTSDETLYYTAITKPNALKPDVVYVVKGGALLRTLPADQVPVIGPDDTLYFSNPAGFSAQQPFGNVKWTAPYPLPSAIDANGRLYSIAGTNIIALDFTGAFLWQTGLAATPNAILIGENGRAFVRSDTGLTVLGTNGAVLWTNNTSDVFAPLADGGAVAIQQVFKPFTNEVNPGDYLNPKWVTFQHIASNGRNEDFSSYFFGSSRKSEVVSGISAHAKL